MSTSTIPKPLTSAHDAGMPSRRVASVPLLATSTRPSWIQTVCTLLVEGPSNRKVQTWTFFASTWVGLRLLYGNACGQQASLPAAEQLMAWLGTRLVVLLTYGVVSPASCILTVPSVLSGYLPLPIHRVDCTQRSTRGCCYKSMHHRPQ